MDIRQMRQVLEICRCESFAKAARALGVSQPTLSRSIARLEDQLGVILFDRSESGARPTSYGRMVAERAAELLRGAEALSSEIRSTAAGEAGRIRIGVGPAVRDWIWPALAAAILRRFPDLHLSVQQDPPTVTGPMVAANQLDLALGTVDTLGKDSRLIARRVATDEVIFVARPDHPLARAPGSHGSGPHALSALLDHPLAHVGLPPSFHGLLISNATSEQHRNVLGFRCADYGYVAHVLAAGRAIAPGPRAIFRRELAAGTLAEIDVALAFTVDCSVMCTPQSLRSPVVREIVDLAVEVGAAAGRRAAGAAARA